MIWWYLSRKIATWRLIVTRISQLSTTFGQCLNSTNWLTVHCWFHYESWLFGYIALRNWFPVSSLTTTNNSAVGQCGTVIHWYQQKEISGCNYVEHHGNQPSLLASMKSRNGVCNRCSQTATGHHDVIHVWHMSYREESWPSVLAVADLSD